MRALALSSVLALTALPISAEGFNSPNGWSLELPAEWEAFPPEDAAKLRIDDPDTSTEGAWHGPLGLPMAWATWWRGSEAANEAAGLVALAGNREKFLREFKRQVGKKLKLTDVEVRKHDTRRHVVSVAGTMTQDGVRLRTYVSFHATKDGAVLLYFCVKEEDRDLHSATFDGIVGSLKLAPGREYVPFPIGLVGGIAGAVVAVVVFLAARAARKQQ